MPDLDSYFEIDKEKHDGHPLIRLLDAQQGKPEFGVAKVEIIRPRAALGFEPAILSLQFFNQQGQLFDNRTELWDANLNEALLDRNIQAINAGNEIRRFGLGLGAAFRYSESRYGDGFFNAALMLAVNQSPLAVMAPIRELIPYISTHRFSGKDRSSEDCREMIQAVLQDRWLELRRKLNYDKTNAEHILAGALAYYLDERFSITDGQKLGWLKTH